MKSSRTPKQYKLARITGMARAIETRLAVERRYGVRLSWRTLTPKSTTLHPDKWEFELCAGREVSQSRRMQVKAYIAGAQDKPDAPTGDVTK